MKFRNIKLSEENRGGKLCDLGEGTYSYIAHKGTNSEIKIGNSHFKIKPFCSHKTS